MTEERNTKYKRINHIMYFEKRQECYRKYDQQNKDTCKIRYNENKGKINMDSNAKTVQK